MIEIDSLLQVTKDHQPIGGLFNAAQVLTEEEFNEALAAFVSDKKLLETRLQQANARNLEHAGIVAALEATAEVAATTLSEKQDRITALEQEKQTQLSDSRKEKAELVKQKAALEAAALVSEGVLQTKATELTGVQAELATALADLDAARASLEAKTAEMEAAHTASLALIAANDAEVELIRQNTKTAITMAAQYIHALTETELSEAQAAAVSGLGGVLAFASKSELERQYAAALAAATEAQAKADELAAKINA